MKKIHRLFFLFVFIFASTLQGQSLLNLAQQEKAAASDSIPVKIEPIPLNSINSESTIAFNLFGKVESSKLSKTERIQFNFAVDSIISMTNNFLADTLSRKFENLNFRELEILTNGLLFIQMEIRDIQEKIKRRLQRIQSDRAELRKNRKQWDLTLAYNQPEETPEAIRRRINSVIQLNDSIGNILEKDIDFLLTNSDKVTGMQIRLDQFSSELDAYSKISSSIVFRRDMPSIWRIQSEKDRGIQPGLWQGLLTQFGDDFRLLVKEFHKRLIVALLLLIFLLGLTYWLKVTVKDGDIKVKKVVLSLFVNKIFQKPIEISLLIVLYMLRLLIPELPATYSSVIALITVYAILRISIDILPHEYWKFLIGFSFAYIMLRFSILFYNYQFVSRIILLSSQVIAIVYLLIFIHSSSNVIAKKRKTFNVILSVLGVFYLIFLVVALAGNIAGTMSFSEYLSGAIINSGFLIFTTYIGFQISLALTYLFLSSSIFKNSNIIKHQSSYIFSKAHSFYKFFFIVSWIFIALTQFRIKKVVVDWFSGLFMSDFTIGEATFQLINIVLFIFVIWLSIFISRIVRHVLEEEVFPRVNVERGMPGTITMLVRILLVSIGFMLAAAAAGMKLSSLTIIIGAFSVGIGFGLQNIFNNLVSGLILVFERPIKEGDIVEVSTLMGTVKKIGIRSSIVRTFSGAEVIVPNGELISKDLINWTLSDQFRRIDLKVGVAYGTEPQVVIDLLLKVADENKRVITPPIPKAYFVDFGESSLDFRLLSWVDLDVRLEVESELRLAIHAKLAEAGIEIPFPQTDLHVRSVSEDALKKLK